MRRINDKCKPNRDVDDVKERDTVVATLGCRHCHRPPVRRIRQERRPTGDVEDIKERDTVITTLGRLRRRRPLVKRIGQVAAADRRRRRRKREQHRRRQKPLPPVRPPEQGSRRDRALDGNDGIGRGWQYTAPASSAKSQIMMKQQSNLPA